MGNEVTITADNFESEVLKSNVPVIVDFWAEWCVPCRMVEPVLKEIAAEYDGRLKVAKVNVDDQGQLAAEYNIISIPTLMVVKNGEVVNQQVGAGSKQAILDLVSSYL
ncbi:thioredoxin [Marispirochaeta aestuarii]|uniref:Thioredoxin n=1 Tax=Marispirochaeta aestuarii TaxID=1963862 RepID=A0A1Y1RX40_9SPIO|nr:thioredoxin [Marispirochaeta aestuarii]ORC34860.1 thioredoxin [Marispirochaeta aestuarii]